jgi:hypothetical protein
MISRKALIEVNSVLESIRKDSFTRNDIAVLLVSLRGATSNKTITDLANFHAHPEGRNQGRAHAVVQAWVNNFIAVAESNGGVINGIPPVFTTKGVITELLRALKSSGAKYSEDSIKRNKQQIVEYIISLVDESEFKLDDKRITKCWISKSKGQGLLVNFQAKGLKPGVIKLGEDATIAAQLFN